MALIYRNGRPYLYRSIRRGGRVTSEYRGSGESSALIALADAMDRESEEAEREEERADRQALGDLEDVTRDYFDRVDDLARAALIAAGFHQHKRGEWRKKRGREPS